MEIPFLIGLSEVIAAEIVDELIDTNCCLDSRRKCRKKCKKKETLARKISLKIKKCLSAHEQLDSLLTEKDTSLKNMTKTTSL
jgi:hypothetical protein